MYAFPHHLRRPLAVLLIVAALAPVCFGADKPPAYPTPDAAFKAALAAYDDKDFETLLDGLSPKGLDATMDLAMHIVSRFDRPTTSPARAKANEALHAQQAAMLAKHGLADRTRRPDETDKAFRARLVQQIPDRRTFLMDLYRSRLFRNAAVAERRVNLVELTTDGDTARGREVISDPRDHSTISCQVEFTKIDGSWRIDTVIMY